MRVMKWEAQVDEHGRVKVKADPDNLRDQAAAASVLVQLVRERWQRTKGKLLADKSRAEYLGMFKRFEAWLKDQRIELHDVNHTHLARYRSYRANQIKPKTWNKHCIALSSLLSEALRKPHEYWVPLLCLHQALRANEVCQLKLKDLDFEATPPQLRVCAADEDQQVKTEQSQRTLPLHPRLIELGLREYVASVRAVCGSDMAIACFPNQQQTAVQRLRSVAPSA